MGLGGVRTCPLVDLGREATNVRIPDDRENPILRHDLDKGSMKSEDQNSCEERLVIKLMLHDNADGFEENCL